MAFPTTERAPARPEESILGVPPWRMDIAKYGDYAPDLTTEAAQFLVRLTRTTNTYFDTLAHDMLPEESNEFFTIRMTGTEARKLVYDTAKAVCDVTRDSPNVHLVFFPAGALPIAELIGTLRYPAERMHALEISGSKGTETGSAVIKGTIPPELLDHANNIVVPEDIVDSLKSIFLLILARGIQRDNSSDHVAWLRALGERLKYAHKHSIQDPAAYADFAEAAASEHVSILSVWSKNKQAQQAIIRQNTCGNSTLQRDLLQAYPMMPLPKTFWALGGYYLMDTGVLWSRIREHLSAHLQNDPRVTQYIKRNAEGEIIGQWLIRAVRFGPFGYFKNNTQEENVIRFLARVASEMLAT